MTTDDNHQTIKWKCIVELALFVLSGKDYLVGKPKKDLFGPNVNNICVYFASIIYYKLCEIDCQVGYYGQ